MRQIEAWLGDSGLQVDVMRVVVFPALLPEALNLPHLGLGVHTGCLPCVELADLLLQSVCLDEALRLPDLLAQSQIIVRLPLHLLYLETEAAHCSAGRATWQIKRRDLWKSDRTIIWSESNRSAISNFVQEDNINICQWQRNIANS